MSGWGLANPAGLWWCALAIPIVALHILKPRRVQAPVSALFLWKRVATPVSAAHPWQRLNPSWLLAAQVLAALLLGLLFARPVRLTDQILTEHTIFVVDASASMQSFDGAPDRMASAKEKVLDLRQQIPAGGTASLIVAGTEARALVTNSSDRSAFEKAVDSMVAADTDGAFGSAFALAAGINTGTADTQVVLVSDGGISPADLRAAPVGTRYEPVGSSATNRGITQMSVEQTAEGFLVRLAVTSFGGPESTETVRVDADGVTVATAEVTLHAGEVSNLALPIPYGEKIEAFLEGSDALSLDNRAVAVLPRRAEIHVLWAGSDDPLLESALIVSPGVSITRSDKVPEEIPPEIDVVVASGVKVPDTLELPLLAIDIPGGVRGITPTGTVDDPIITLIRSDASLLANINVGSVFIDEAQKITVPGRAEVLVAAEGAPLMVSMQGNRPTFYMSFQPANSTLPLELAFPVLVDRVLAELSNATSPPARLVVGNSLPIDSRVETIVTDPDGASRTLAPGSSHPKANRVGFWTLTTSEGAETLIAVTADRSESAIAPIPDLAVRTAFEGQGPQETVGQLPFMWPLVAIVVCVLVAEYLLARRRLGVGNRQWKVATGLRVLVAAALVLAALEPGFTFRSNEVATMFVLDASDSMSPAGRAEANSLASQALVDRPEKTRAGVVAFGRDARLEHLVQDDLKFQGLSVAVDPGGTDIAAALRLGAAALPEDARRRLVLITDGRSTSGDLGDEIDRLAVDGIPVDVIVVEPFVGNDVSVVAVDVPPVARLGELVTIDARINSPTASQAEVSLASDGTVIETRTVELQPGENLVRFEPEATNDGVLRYQVDVSTASDPVNANDIGYGAVPVEGASRVLIVEGARADASGLAAALKVAGIEVDIESVGSIPPIDELSRYSSIVMVDVDRLTLSDGQVADLAAAVRDLGRGMLVLGGTHSYAMGGYLNSDLEELLPVTSEITDPKRRQTVAEVFAIDSSGSMGACHCNEEGENGLGGGNRIDGGISKTAIARSAAAQAIAALEATDEVGVLTMDATDRWVVELQASPSPEAIDDGLAQVVPEGPTYLDTGLLTAAEALRKSDASLKHIILFSDGFTEQGNLSSLAAQAADLLAEGITVSVIATGEGAAEDLRPVADAGGGRFYPGRNLDQIPQLIVQEAVLASRDFVNEGEFVPVVASRRPSVSGMTQAPVLFGFVATTPKPTASVDLVIGPENDPLLASWQVGLGRVSAWTSDSGERWAAGWAAWGGSPDFWAGVVKDTFPVVSSEGHVQARIADGQIAISLQGTEAWPNDASAMVRVAGPNGASDEVVLERVDGTTFSGSMSIDEAGTYAIGATISADSQQLWSGVSLANRSYPAEYEPRPVDTFGLARVAELTGGRLNPSSDALFIEAGTVSGRKYYSFTKWLLWLALLAWPIGVALSRLAWRRGALAVGTRMASSTVSELKQRLPKMAAPQIPTKANSPGRGSGVESADSGREPTGRLGASRLKPQVGPWATDQDPPTGPATTPKPSSNPVDAKPSDENTESTVNSLLAARRRKRR